MALGGRELAVAGDTVHAHVLRLSAILRNPARHDIHIWHAAGNVRRLLPLHKQISFVGELGEAAAGRPFHLVMCQGRESTGL